MKRIATLVLLLCTIGARSQQSLPEAPVPSPASPAAVHDRSWERLRSAPPGMTVSVLTQGAFDAVSCQLEYVSDETFACTAYRNYGPPPRLVFPRRNVAAVWGEQQVESSQWTPLIVAGAVVGVFTIVGGSQDGGRGAGVGALLGCLFGGGIAGAMISHGPVPPHLHTRRRILYRAP
ncbi:hypothetical protein SAMN05421770_101239 [Granulicella rosea]|uniref:Uncharacterized protein n=1 Tax=Granulicella rosea TaxID=474952 RepID=A0A239D315_9BACT|nr:hypothetical protein [Granulicella rosea]SNS26224.1 hypothetical protein SAMN05421770_101239 [Granulicella rosea]